ncbi:transposase, partial [Klebsiella quasipneumoniae]|nr:transposase [Klebsiella quasipneumoniae]
KTAYATIKGIEVMRALRKGQASAFYYGDPLGEMRLVREGANKQVISSQADSLIKISRIWADFFPANTSNQPI